MKLSRILLLLLGISLAILGCREDEIEFIPTDDTETMSTEIMSTVDLTGFVVDPDGNPVSDATVLYKAEEAVTDDTGFYLSLIHI